MEDTKKKKKILIADDDPAILDAVSLLLQDEGYDVVTTVDGATVVTMLEEKPNILLLDIWMSGQDGRDICRLLKSQRQTKDTPIIMISANRDTETIAKEAGADDFLAKPFDIDELLEKIKKFI